MIKYKEAFLLQMHPGHLFQYSRLVLSSMRFNILIKREDERKMLVLEVRVLSCEKVAQG